MNLAFDRFPAIRGADTLKARVLLLPLAGVHPVRFPALHSLHRPAVQRVRGVVDVPGCRTGHLERVRPSSLGHSGVVGLARDFVDGVGPEAGLFRGASGVVRLCVERRKSGLATFVAGFDLFSRRVVRC